MTQTTNYSHARFYDYNILHCWWFITENPALDSRRKLSDAQEITTLLISSRYFYGNQYATCQYMKEHWGFVMPDKSNVNRILHRLADLLTELFYHLYTIFKKLNIESVLNSSL